MIQEKEIIIQYLLHCMEVVTKKIKMVITRRDTTITGKEILLAKKDNLIVELQQIYRIRMKRSPSQSLQTPHQSNRLLCILRERYIVYGAFPTSTLAPTWFDRVLKKRRVDKQLVVVNLIHSIQGVAYLDVEAEKAAGGEEFNLLADKKGKGDRTEPTIEGVNIIR